jgi:septal ring factor EnvC (AmiA/AmiB activator)
MSLERIKSLKEHLRTLKTRYEGLLESKKRNENQLAESTKKLESLATEIPKIEGFIAGTKKQLEAFGDFETQKKMQQIEDLKAQIAALEGR